MWRVESVVEWLSHTQITSPHTGHSLLARLMIGLKPGISLTSDKKHKNFCWVEAFWQMNTSWERLRNEPQSTPQEQLKELEQWIERKINSQGLIWDWCLNVNLGVFSPNEQNVNWRIQILYILYILANRIGMFTLTNDIQILSLSLANFFSLSHTHTDPACSSTRVLCNTTWLFKTSEQYSPTEPAGAVAQVWRRPKLCPCDSFYCSKCDTCVCVCVCVLMWVWVQWGGVRGGSLSRPH